MKPIKANSFLTQLKNLTTITISNISHVIEDLVSAAGVYILIGAGSLVMLVGFFGCCGAVRESQCLLGSVSTNTLYESLRWLVNVFIHKP